MRAAALSLSLSRLKRRNITNQHKQYFLWYLIFLPLYLPQSSLLRQPATRGLPALLLWVATQAAWLSQGYNLEFLGLSTFVPGLWLSSLAFFLVNCWILGIIVGDF